MKDVQCYELFGGIAHKNHTFFFIFMFFFTRVFLSGIHFTAELTEALRLETLAQGHNKLLLLEFEPSTSVSKNRHPNKMTNMILPEQKTNNHGPIKIMSNVT